VNSAALAPVACRFAFDDGVMALFEAAHERDRSQNSRPLLLRTVPGERLLIRGERPRLGDDAANIVTARYSSGRGFNAPMADDRQPFPQLRPKMMGKEMGKVALLRQGD